MVQTGVAAAIVLGSIEVWPTKRQDQNRFEREDEVAKRNTKMNEAVADQCKRVN